MKTVINLALGLALCTTAAAQNSPAGNILEQYSGVRGYQTAHITEYMFNTFLALAEDDAEAEVQSLVGNLTDVRLLTVDTAGGQLANPNFYPDITTALTEQGYMTLQSMQSNGKGLKLMVHGDAGTMDELALVGESFMAVLSGEIELQQILLLAEALDVEALEQDMLEEE